MAGTSLLSLIDDIAGILDDVAVLSKVAAKKTAGVLGDDLALNAQQVSGVQSEREWPVVWSVAKGSAVNKVILVPLALLISAFAPSLVKILLTLGGLYLCFEGAEKVIEKFWPHSKTEEESQESEKQSPVSEKDKIKGAIRTDFILSAEIIVISLGSMSEAPILQQVLSLAGVAIAMTVGVYGFVALIVKLDDLGIYLINRPKASFAYSSLNTTGKVLLNSAPYLMKSLGVIGTVAMFLVGGGLIVHSFETLHHLLSGLNSITNSLAEGVVGLIAGILIVLGLHIPKLFKSGENK